ncbi:CPBP family intramembrane glutamic endopeptidase [Sutcliffiella horikoshii]|uniref:CPBP family intramembrane glutamic endopeptidase n=1 Tax=Sutcliffiella horikoshii TaxID=79883 RepID=UPI001F1C7343|nr:CPBP family intramembrane glutamic endopeptidase [Sutcliffiella horikoshii]MCG1020260.1 CPBP family intramembrane metalloprotease [Sutcliffiella horikoshii]
MKSIRFTVGIWMVANLLLGISFQLINHFWILFPLSLLILTLISISSGLIETHKRGPFTSQDIIYGFMTGSILYGLFLLTYLLLKVLPLPLLPYVVELYKIVGPSSWWHYVALIIIIIPGEEIFWRGFIQKRMIKVLGRVQGVLAAAFLYALAHIWTGNPMLVAAALTAGIIWGGLYEWKKSLALIILSHLVFDLWLLVIFPLNF